MENMAKGYALIPRIVLEYPDDEKRYALMLLYMKVTYDEQTVKGVKLRRGQLFLTIHGFARELNWNRQKVRRFLADLERQKGEAWAIEQEIIKPSTINPMNKPRQIGKRITFIYYNETCGELPK
ncbi:hypothetical protein ES703_116604 [subsurface metagenome]